MTAPKFTPRNPSARITPAQITAIKMGQRALGIDDETYRATLWERYRADSCTDLNHEQATDLIEDYISRGFVLIQPEAKASKWKNRKQQHPRPASAKATAGRPAIPRDSSKVVGMVRPEEIDKINKVARLVTWRAENGLALFLEKRMGIKDGKVKTSQEAYLAIEGLKKLFENEMKARHGEAWWTMKFGNPEIMTYIREHCPREWR